MAVSPIGSVLNIEDAVVDGGTTSAGVFNFDTDWNAVKDRIDVNTTQVDEIVAALAEIKVLLKLMRDNATFEIDVSDAEIDTGF